MVQTTALNPQKRDEVRRFAAQLRRAGIPFDTLIVFGSHAKGSAKPWSDLDVCVVSRIFGQDRHTERVKLMQIKAIRRLLSRLIHTIRKILQILGILLSMKFNNTV